MQMDRKSIYCLNRLLESRVNFFFLSLSLAFLVTIFTAGLNEKLFRGEQRDEHSILRVAGFQNS